MENGYMSILTVISLILVVSAPAEEGTFEYPCYLLDTYNPQGYCWMGMNAQGAWPIYVQPDQYLVGPPPKLNVSGVTIPIDCWVELKFPGRIVDGPGDDILLAELDQVGEQALIFLTNGQGGSRPGEVSEEYLLGLASVPKTDIRGPTQIGFDIAGLSLPFVPTAVRIVGTDLLGGSPGFDLAYVQARTDTDCRYAACYPCPPDGTENVPIDIELMWSADSSVDVHHIYFGETPNDVDANAVPLENPNSIIQNSKFHFSPGLLGLGKTYYWRIDEVNQSDNTIRTGDIWRFTTKDHLILEDFESDENRNRWEQAGNGWMFFVNEPHHGCHKALGYQYQCRGDFIFSEVGCFFEPAQDWSATDDKTLALYFFGSQFNQPGAKMNLAIGDGAVNLVFPYPGDPNDLMKEQWQLWTIDLEDTPDINFSNIEYIFIGFVSEDPQTTNLISGYVYFDDITLHSSFCAQQNRPVADFDCDCIVDFKDLDEMAENWLESGYNICPAVAPNEPLAWYKFDGDTYDSAGGTYAQIMGSPSFVQGVFNQAIEFGGYEDYVEVSGAESLFSNISTAITICFWQNGMDSDHHTDTLFCTNFEYGLYDPAIAINLGCWKSPGRYNWDCGSPLSSNKRLWGNHKYPQQWRGQWNHWAFTKDARDGKMQVFLNGRLIDSRTGSDSLITTVETFQIGSGWYGGYDGLIDELQIYDYALSGPEIVYAATNGTGIFDLQLATQADLNKDNKVDFTDFAILAETWLIKQ